MKASSCTRQSWRPRPPNSARLSERWSLQGIDRVIILRKPSYSTRPRLVRVPTGALVCHAAQEISAGLGFQGVYPTTQETADHRQEVGME